MRKLAKAMAVSAVLLWASGAAAIDLDGTLWEGTFRCKGVNGDGNKSILENDEITLSISQTGPDAVATFDFGGGPTPYDASVVADADMPETRGALGFVHPETDNDAAPFDEVVWGKVSYDDETGKGTFKGTGTRILNGGGFDTCKWRFKAVPLF